MGGGVLDQLKKMISIENAISSVWVTMIAYLFHGDASLLVVLFALMAFDLITGIAKNIKAYMVHVGLSTLWALFPLAWPVLWYMSLQPGYLESSRMKEGMWKFVGYMALIILAALANKVIEISHLQKFIPAGLPEDLPIVYAFAYLGLREIKSILENLGTCGVTAATNFHAVLCNIEAKVKSILTTKMGGSSNG